MERGRAGNHRTDDDNDNEEEEEEEEEDDATSFPRTFNFSNCNGYFQKEIEIFIHNIFYYIKCQNQKNMCQAIVIAVNRRNKSRRNRKQKKEKKLYPVTTVK
ncbi:hypothetical protein KPH14_009005 [Odynerus spinipes]|uniref:Uncharacterized protein n=1 Tax=Odynerus spinipes TaxID=1348599 RepID=A0AAD9RNE6_9HYME|nr:hypothetical protein KPH14_009005 [Odynerus spinipes]